MAIVVADAGAAEFSSEFHEDFSQRIFPASSIRIVYI